MKGGVWLSDIRDISVSRLRTKDEDEADFTILWNAPESDYDYEDSANSKGGGPNEELSAEGSDDRNTTSEDASESEMSSIASEPSACKIDRAKREQKTFDARSAWLSQDSGSDYFKDHCLENGQRKRRQSQVSSLISSKPVLRLMRSRSNKLISSFFKVIEQQPPGMYDSSEAEQTEFRMRIGEVDLLDKRRGGELF